MTTLSFEDSYKLFNSESENLFEIIDSVSKKEEKTILEITDMYYQVIKIRGLAQILKDNFKASTNSEHRELVNKIDKIQEFLVTNFDKTLHLEILDQLKNKDLQLLERRD